ncbi:MAG: hypothetical protein AB7G13_10965 [Lautropia sp.]
MKSAMKSTMESALALARPVGRVARSAAVLTVLSLGAGMPAVAQPPRAPAAPATLASLTVAELERMFWVCDRMATVSVLDVDRFTSCAATADELKARRFDGDFDKMIDWWRENKAAAHAGLQAGRDTAERRR